MKPALIIVPAAVLAASLGFLFASCGANEAQPAGPVPTVDTNRTGSTVETDGATEASESTTSGGGGDAQSGHEVTYQLWFAQGESLFVSYRTQEATPRVGSAAVEALLAGPSEFEQGYGLTTSVPEGTEFLGLRI